MSITLIIHNVRDLKRHQTPMSVADSILRRLSVGLSLFHMRARGCGLAGCMPTVLTCALGVKDHPKLLRR